MDLDRAGLDRAGLDRAGPSPRVETRGYAPAPPVRRFLNPPETAGLALLALLGLSAALLAAAPAELATRMGSESSRALETAAARAREQSRALARRGSWSTADVRALAALQLVDPERFVADEAFRRQVLGLLPRALDPAVPAGLRDALLRELNQVRGIDFAASEAIEAAWGAAPRRSAGRRVAFRSGDQAFDPDVEGRLAASVYSLPSFFFDAAAAGSFLAAVRAADPERTLIVLTDQPLLGRLETLARELKIHLLDTHGRPYSPWPRDPFSLTRARGGGVRLLVRPNVQTGREEDLHLGPELVQTLPDAVDRAWGGVTWAEAPVPFHNGQVLLTRDAAWMTLHALEPRLLALLGLDRVPVETFATAAGIDRYVEAARKAAADLGALYGRPVRFVHPLPAPGSGDAALMRSIGGAAGYDLDSIATFLPKKDGRLAALVADVSLGRGLLAKAAPDDLAALRSGYGLEPPGDRLAAAQQSPSMAGLDAFLDLAARHLAAEGFEVRRLPLLALPVALLRDRTGLAHEEFLMTWNNVVVETRKGTVRAEGFASLFPAGDRLARETFGDLEARLDLFPPLVRSVILNGGYRCASNHLRTGAAGPGRDGTRKPLSPDTLLSR